MNPGRRLDIVIGLFASAIAVMGLAISMLAGNEDACWFGRIIRSDQTALLVIAIAVFGMALAKAIYARCR